MLITGLNDQGLKYMYIALWSCKEVFWQIPDFMRYKSSHKDTQSSFLRSRSLFPSWIFPKPLLLFTMYYKRTPIDPWMTPPCNASWPMAGPAPRKCLLVGYEKKIFCSFSHFMLDFEILFKNL